MLKIKIFVHSLVNAITMFIDSISTSYTWNLFHRKAWYPWTVSFPEEKLIKYLEKQEVKKLAT